MQLKVEDWADYKEQKTKLIKVFDENTGFEVHLSDFGATLVRVKMKDKEGKIDDINFGCDSPAEYISTGAYFGAVVGRVTNRIENAKFTLGGKTYNLYVNNANLHSLHGGKEGFNVKMWNLVENKIVGDEALVRFEYFSADGEENYPGNLKVKATYIIKTNSLEWIFEAETDKMTIVNMTNHAYWNLDGLNALTDEQVIEIDSNAYMPGDENDLPTGEVRLVKETAYDLREPKLLSDIYNSAGDIDNSYFVNGYLPEESVLTFAGSLYSKKTGRMMKIYTDQPVIHVYTGNYMDGIKSFGVVCKKHSAVCFETQKVSNAINIPYFREQVILKPGELYKHHTKHEFMIKN